MLREIPPWYHVVHPADMPFDRFRYSPYTEGSKEKCKVYVKGMLPFDCFKIESEQIEGSCYTGYQSRHYDNVVGGLARAKHYWIMLFDIGVLASGGEGGSSTLVGLLGEREAEGKPYWFYCFGAEAGLKSRGLRGVDPVITASLGLSLSPDDLTDKRYDIKSCFTEKEIDPIKPKNRVLLTVSREDSPRIERFRIVDEDWNDMLSAGAVHVPEKIEGYEVGPSLWRVRWDESEDEKWSFIFVCCLHGEHPASSICGVLMPYSGNGSLGVGQRAGVFAAENHTGGGNR
ncbi:MAG: hypothetical protein AAGD01_17385 [Acidobacteriota bacterium]